MILHAAVVVRGGQQIPRFARNDKEFLGEWRCWLAAGSSPLRGSE
jgi:hypothetical protein